MLGVTERTYRRQLERAMRKVSERYEVVRAGLWCDDRRELILEFVSGLASPDQADLARAHIKSCPGCARMAAELRETTRSAAALLPMPVVFSGGALARFGDTAGAMRDWISDTVSIVARQVASVVSRVDPNAATYVPAARPGGMAAALVACVAIGGGTTYCLVEGVPDSLQSIVGADASEPSKEPERRPDPEPAAVTTEVAPPPVAAPPIRPQLPSPQPASAPQQQQQEAREQSEPQAQDQVESAVPAEQSEFSPEAPAPAAPAPAPTPVAPSDSGSSSTQASQGEFDF